MLYQSVKKGSQTSVENLQNTGVEKDAEESKHEEVDGQYKQNAVTNGEVQTSLKESQQIRMTSAANEEKNWQSNYIS